MLRLRRSASASFVCGVLVAAVCLILVYSGCTERKLKPSFDPNTNEDSSISPDEITPPTVIFPHPDNWDKPTSHGNWVLRNDKAVCFKCHTTKPTLSKGGPPACNSCHDLYPHPGDWLKKHGGLVPNIGVKKCGTACHGEDYQGGLSKKSCYGCHKIYPHTPNWEQPEIHGPAAKGDQKEDCQTCHGEDYKGGRSKTSCLDCHDGLYPHESGWINKHKTKVKAVGMQKCATACHGTDLLGGLSGKACIDCHGGVFPHSPQWVSKVSGDFGGAHGAARLELGMEVCNNCHGPNGKKFINGKNCYTCHAGGDYPHSKPEIWTPYATGHGKKIQETYAKNTASCQKCHGLDLKRVIKEKNCVTCHASYPHLDKVIPATESTPEITTPWEDFEGHGTYTLAHTKEECTQCHGEDYMGGPRGNPSCYSCHESYPHQTGWKRPEGQPQDHGIYVNAHSSLSCATTRCHGEDFEPNLDPALGPVTNGPNCSTFGCHNDEAYPHPTGWLGVADITGLHGPAALESIGSCKTCHSDLDKAPPGHQTCTECHATYLQHSSAEMGVVGWNTFAGHGSYVMGPNFDEKISGCQLCHGENYTGGVSEVNCLPCHNGVFPHTEDWFSSVPANFGGAHGAAAYGAGKNSCDSVNCHGVNFEGNPPLVQGCKNTSCHPNFPHTNPQWLAGGGIPVHTTTFIQDINAGNAAACAECHDHNDGGAITYERVVGGFACTMCHPLGQGGVTHRTGWAAGSGHGQGHFIAYNTSTSTGADCFNCHGDVEIFTETQILADLQTPDNPGDPKRCYECHHAYPHFKYDRPDPNPPLTWSHSSGEWGSGFYLLQSPLLITSTGIHPNVNLPEIVPAIQNTCGGNSVNQCHFEGYRSPPVSMSTPVCGGYCHQ